MYLVVFHLDSGWKFSEFNRKEEVFKWPNLTVMILNVWLLVYLSDCIRCQQRSILQGRARPRWGNERTWSGIERTLHCTINIIDDILHIKLYLKKKLWQDERSLQAFRFSSGGGFCFNPPSSTLQKLRQSASFHPVLWGRNESISYIIHRTI